MDEGCYDGAVGTTGGLPVFLNVGLAPFANRGRGALGLLLEFGPVTKRNL